MGLFKLRLEVASRDVGRSASGLLTELPAPQAIAVTLFEHGPAFVVEAYYDHEPALDAVEHALAGLGLDLDTPSVEAVADQNWVALSQAALPPISAGRFIVHGSHDRERFAARRYAIEIDAGEAFGTGHNITTAACLEAIDGLARRQRFARVLDLGCGTGLLAIAAARVLPAARVIASDNDRVATAVARQNVRLNRVRRRVHVIDAEGFEHRELRGVGTFDLVIANILPGPLIDLAPAMRVAVERGGAVVLSGLLSHQAREVIGAYLAAGFQLAQRRDQAGWAALTLTRR
jgi:ribosomal protein L11 methyltransferase